MFIPNKRMVGNTGTLMTMRIVRSKLRKRDEPTEIANTVVNIDAQQQKNSHQSRTNTTDANHYSEDRAQQLLSITSISDNNENPASSAMELDTITFARTSGGCSTTNDWIFPPKAPSPNIYNYINHDEVVTMGERNGFKGFKKQFSGRFKRLVSHKKDATSPIPPELKPQLKTIYVY